MKDNVIVYSPWGGGGDLIRNIITLDPRFDYADDAPPTETPPVAEDRYKFFLDYYSSLPHRPINRFYSRYYNNNAIAYWNPDSRVAYQCNGSIEEIDRIQSKLKLAHYDRSGIEAKRVNEQLSNGTLKECSHVFLIPKNLALINQAHCIANPALIQFSQEQPVDRRQKQATIINKLRHDRLRDLATALPEAYKYTADELYTPMGSDLIEQIIQDINIDVPVKYIYSLHSQWLNLYKELM